MVFLCPDRQVIAVNTPGLFCGLTLQLVLAINRSAIVACSGCGDMFSPVRQARTDRRVFRPKCGHKGAVKLTNARLPRSKASQERNRRMMPDRKAWPSQHQIPQLTRSAPMPLRRVAPIATLRSWGMHYHHVQLNNGQTNSRLSRTGVSRWTEPSTAAKPVTQATAERALSQFLERVTLVNHNPYFLAKVTNRVLFGGMLKPEVAKNRITSKHWSRISIGQRSWPA